MKIKLPRSTFNQRIILLFTEFIKIPNFSRLYNTKEQLDVFIEVLKSKIDTNFQFDKQEEFNINNIENNETIIEINTTNQNISKNRKKPQTKKENKIIPLETTICFNDDALDTLFNELKRLSINHKNCFAILLRTYLEKSLYYYISKNKLENEFITYYNKNKKENRNKKVDILTKFIKNTYNVNEDIDKEKIMNILKFNKEINFSIYSLKYMMDFIIHKNIFNERNAEKYKSTSEYLFRIKSGLDLAVHNYYTVVDIDHNRKAWKHLEPLFISLSSNTN